MSDPKWDEFRTIGDQRKSGFGVRIKSLFAAVVLWAILFGAGFAFIPMALPGSGGPEYQNEAARAMARDDAKERAIARGIIGGAIGAGVGALLGAADVLRGRRR